MYQEWMLAAQCVQVEESERIGKFHFSVDAKLAMVSIPACMCVYVGVSTVCTCVCTCVYARMYVCVCECK